MLGKQRKYSKQLIISVVILAILFGGDFLGLKLKAENSEKPLSISADSPKENAVQPLTQEEKDQLAAIIHATMQDAAMPTTEAHEQFWNILTRNGTEQVTTSTLDTLFNEYAGLAEYQTIFYEDALESLSIGKPYKSDDRVNFGNALLESGQMTAEEISQYDKLMQDIARKIPGHQPGGTIMLYDNEAVEIILSEMEPIMERVLLLFGNQRNGTDDGNGIVAVRQSKNEQLSF